jgi:hypothetical protein
VQGLWFDRTNKLIPLCLEPCLGGARLAIQMDKGSIDGRYEQCKAFGRT